MNELLKELVDTHSQGGAAALATVISRQGPTPMASEAKMLTRADGKIVGTVGGGCTEAQVQSAGKKLLLDGLSRTLDFTLTRKQAGEEGHICGGKVQIFLEPVRECTVACAQEAIKLSETGRPCAWATLICRAGAADLGENTKMLVRADGTTLGSLGNEALAAKVTEEGVKAIREQTPQIVSFDDQTEVFIEPMPVVPTVYVFGAGHVSCYLAKMAKLLGFRVVLTDDRSQFANRERFPEADEIIVDDFEVACNKLAVNQFSYLVIVTRGHLHDAEVLEWAVETKSKYIGMIGSRAKVRILFRDLESKGFKKESLAKVHAPIGLDIKAETPEEIALSIAAEMILVRRQRQQIDSDHQVGLKKVVPKSGPAGWA